MCYRTNARLICSIDDVVHAAKFTPQPSASSSSSCKNDSFAPVLFDLWSFDTAALSPLLAPCWCCRCCCWLPLLFLKTCLFSRICCSSKAMALLRLACNDCKQQERQHANRIAARHASSASSNLNQTNCSLNLLSCYRSHSSAVRGCAQFFQNHH